VHCLERPDWPGQSDDGCSTTQLPDQQGLPSETLPTATDSAAAGPTAAATLTDATTAATADLAHIEHSNQYTATAAPSGQHAPCSRSDHPTKPVDHRATLSVDLHQWWPHRSYPIADFDRHQRQAGDREHHPEHHHHQYGQLTGQPGRRWTP